MKTKSLLAVLYLVLVGIAGLFWRPGVAAVQSSGEFLSSHPDNQQAEVILELVGHLGDDSQGVFTVGDRAYVTLGAELAVLDISDPAHPRRIGYTVLPGTGGGVYVAGSYAYVGSDTGCLWIVNIANPSAPTVVGSYTAFSWGAWGVYAVGNYVYGVGENALHVVDVSDPANPTLAGSLTFGNTNWDAHVSGNYAYVAGDTGLHVVDVSDPAAPVEVTSLATYSNGVYVVGQYAYLTDFEITVKSQLLVVDISDPTDPQQVAAADGLFGVYGPWGSLADVYIAGDYAYVSGTLRSWDGRTIGGIQIVDISDPTDPQLRETYLRDEIDYPRQVSVTGSYALLAGGGAGLRVVDVSNSVQTLEFGG